MTPRPCGPCQVCCEALWVEQVQSLAGDRCRHQCATGCGIHGQPERPRACGSFLCAWARHDPFVPDRPDISGVLVWRDGDEVAVRELREGALDADWVFDAFAGWGDVPVVAERLTPSLAETAARAARGR